MKKIRYGIVKDDTSFFYLTWGVLHIELWWSYCGFRISFIPKLFKYHALLKRKVFQPELSIEIRLWGALSVEITFPYKIVHKDQGKYQVKNFIYNGFSGAALPGYAKWEVRSVTGWTDDPGILEVMGTDGLQHFVPKYCLSEDLVKELPAEPELKPFEGKGVLFGSPSRS